MGEFTAKALANTVWAFATAGYKDVAFAVFVRATERRVAEFTAQDLANTTWAFTTAQSTDVPVFTMFQRAV